MENARLIQPKRHRLTVAPKDALIEKLKVLREPAELRNIPDDRLIGACWKNDGRWAWFAELD